MNKNILLSLLLLIASYFVVTFVGFIHMIILNRSFSVPSAKQAGVPMSKSPAYHATIQYHPIYNLLIFPCFALIYLIQVNPVNLWHEMLVTGITWAVVSIIVDYIGWVAIPHPWQLTYKEFYIDYQPWITFIYIIIFSSPFIAGVILHYIL